MEGTYAIVASNDSVREFVLSKWSDDQSENEVFSGLSVLEDTSDSMSRKVTLTRPRVADAYSFPFDASGETQSFEIEMITAMSSSEEAMLAYHGQQRSAYERMELIVSDEADR